MTVDIVKAYLKKCIISVHAVLTAFKMILFSSEKANTGQGGVQNRFCIKVGDNLPRSPCITCLLIASCNKSTLSCVPSSIRSAGVKSGKFKKSFCAVVNSKISIESMEEFMVLFIES